MLRHILAALRLVHNKSVEVTCQWVQVPCIIFIQVSPAVDLTKAELQNWQANGTAVPPEFSLMKTRTSTSQFEVRMTFQKRLKEKPSGQSAQNFLNQSMEYEQKDASTR